MHTNVHAPAHPVTSLPQLEFDSACLPSPHIFVCHAMQDRPAAELEVLQHRLSSIQQAAPSSRCKQPVMQPGLTQQHPFVDLTADSDDTATAPGSTLEANMSWPDRYQPQTPTQVLYRKLVLHVKEIETSSYC